jgi:hypothetical protein
MKIQACEQYRSCVLFAYGCSVLLILILDFNSRWSRQWESICGGSLSTFSEDFNKITISKQCERNSIEEATYTELIMQITKLSFKCSGEWNWIRIESILGS